MGSCRRALAQRTFLTPNRSRSWSSAYWPTWTRVGVLRAWSRRSPTGSPGNCAESGRRVEFVSDRLVQPPTDLSELIAAGRRMLLERGWHLAVCVTDLPLQTARRPVIAHVSATHGVAVRPCPALGPVSVRKRTAETIVRLVGHILGDLAQAEGAAERLPLAEAVTRRMRELGARTERGEHGVVFVARVITGNIWLLLAPAPLPVAAGAAAHARAGGGLRGRGVRAGRQSATSGGSPIMSGSCA